MINSNSNSQYPAMKLVSSSDFKGEFNHDESVSNEATEHESVVFSTSTPSESENIIFFTGKMKGKEIDFVIDMDKTTYTYDGVCTEKKKTMGKTSRSDQEIVNDYINVMRNNGLVNGEILNANDYEKEGNYTFRTIYRRWGGYIPFSKGVRDYVVKHYGNGNDTTMSNNVLSFDAILPGKKKATLNIDMDATTYTNDGVTTTIPNHIGAKRLNDQELIDDIVKVAAKLNKKSGDYLTINNYKSNGIYSMNTYERRFGNFRLFTKAVIEHMYSDNSVGNAA